MSENGTLFAKSRFILLAFTSYKLGEFGLVTCIEVFCQFI